MASSDLNGVSRRARAKTCLPLRREKAQRVGAAMCAAMKEKLSRQMFEVVIQAAANGKIIARETLKVCPFRLTLHGPPSAV